MTKPTNAESGALDSFQNHFCHCALIWPDQPCAHNDQVGFFSFWPIKSRPDLAIEIHFGT